MRDPDDRRGAHWTDSDILLVHAPGSSPDARPEDMAKFIPAGSALVFRMHYTTNGHPGSDRTRIGLVFSRHALSRRVLTLQHTNDHFLIRPLALDFRVEERGTLPNDATLLRFMPHMHLRGTRFEYNIIHWIKDSSGKPIYEIEPLLRVNYHFHWQMSYRLAHLRFLKAGTELQAVALVRQLSAESAQPGPRPSRALGRADLRRKDGRFFRCGRARRDGQTAVFHQAKELPAACRLPACAGPPRRRSSERGAYALFAI